MYKRVVSLIILFVFLFLGVSAIGIFNKKKDLQTKALFMQTKFQKIELPLSDTSSVNGSHLLIEQVTYNHADNELKDKSNKTIATGKINEVQHLNEVVVTAKSKFTPEHNGKVTVDFVIKVPKEMISPEWRLTLMPKLIPNDTSTVELQKLVLRGNVFKSEQKNDSAKYDDYLKSIVDKSKYDSAFLKNEFVNKEIYKFQNIIYQRYKEDWNRHKWYMDELAKFKQQEQKLALEEKIYRGTKYAEYARQVKEEQMKRYIDNRYTSGIYKKVMYDFDKDLTRKNVDYQKKKDKIIDKQLSYRTTDFPLQNTPNKNFLKQDSIDISKYSYDFKKIAKNEIKEENKENVSKQLIKFDEKDSVRLDTLVSDSRNFVYNYRQEYPVFPGMKKIKIFLDAKVESVDQSGYFLPAADTLSYFISSISQLVDTSWSIKYRI